MLPATGIAAHADDEGADLMGTEKAPVFESALGGNSHGSDYDVSNMQTPPPPPLKESNSKVSLISLKTILPLYSNCLLAVLLIRVIFCSTEQSIRRRI